MSAMMYIIVSIFTGGVYVCLFYYIFWKLFTQPVWPWLFFYLVLLDSITHILNHMEVCATEA